MGVKGSPPMRIFFTGGRLIDGRGGLIERGSVLIEGKPDEGRDDLSRRTYASKILIFAASFF